VKKRCRRYEILRISEVALKGLVELQKKRLSSMPRSLDLMAKLRFHLFKHSERGRSKGGNSDKTKA